MIHGFQCPWQVWNKYIEYCAYRLKSAKPASWNLRFQRPSCVNNVIKIRKYNILFFFDRWKHLSICICQKFRNTIKIILFRRYDLKDRNRMILISVYLNDIAQDWGAGELRVCSATFLQRLLIKSDFCGELVKKWWKIIC